MALMTGEQYIESMRKKNLQVYMFGKKVPCPADDPILRPSMNSVRMTYDLAQQPEYQDLMTAISPYTGERVNRFTHIHQSTTDLMNKVKMQRLCGQKTASCFQRCVGMDAFNAVFSTTYDTDKKYGTKYHENFMKFLKRVQMEDLTVDGAMTDPKGDRGLAPHAQADPDLYLHVVERRPDVGQKLTKLVSLTLMKSSSCRPSLWVKMIKIMQSASPARQMRKVFS